MSTFKTIFLSAVTTLFIVSAGFAYFYYTQVKEDKSGNNNGEIVVQHAANNIVIDSKKDTSNDKTAANNNLYNSRQTVITKTVAKVSPAVVGITVTEIQKYRDFWSYDPFFREFFGDRVYLREVKGLGSGTLISPDGYIITNDHVAGNAVKIIVTLTDGRHFDAKIVGSDITSDVCLLKIDSDNLPYLKFGDSDDILIGEWVIALGNPFGLFELNKKPTVTVGVISSLGMNLGVQKNRYYYDMIQTDAAINTGNSGGPLVNSIGEIIGMNTLIYSGSGGNIGVGFAIPINKVKEIIADLKEYGKVDRNFWTGLSIQTITEGIAKYFNLKNTEGVIVTDIVPDSPADKAGLQVADIILEMNKVKINDDVTMINLLHTFKTNDTVQFKILRKGETLIKTMILEPK